jgi:hypothetical protein
MAYCVVEGTTCLPLSENRPVLPGRFGNEGPAGPIGDGFERYDARTDALLIDINAVLGVKIDFEDSAIVESRYPASACR